MWQIDYGMPMAKQYASFTLWRLGGGGGGGGRGQNKGYSMGFLFVCSLHHFDNTCTKFNKSSAERGDINPFGFIV